MCAVKECDPLPRRKHPPAGRTASLTTASPLARRPSGASWDCHACSSISLLASFRTNGVGNAQSRKHGHGGRCWRLESEGGCHRRSVERARRHFTSMRRTVAAATQQRHVCATPWGKQKSENAIAEFRFSVFPGGGTTAREAWNGAQFGQRPLRRRAGRQPSGDWRREQARPGRVPCQSPGH